MSKREENEKLEERRKEVRFWLSLIIVFAIASLFLGIFIGWGLNTIQWNRLHKRSSL